MNADPKWLLWALIGTLAAFAILFTGIIFFRGRGGGSGNLNLNLDSRIGRREPGQESPGKRPESQARSLTGRGVP